MMRIEEDWIVDPDTKAVCEALSGHQVYFVDGCVRNSLMGLPIADIDISTDARPEQVIESAKNAGLKSIPTGIDHGTVTILSGGRAFEVTTFRRDVATDGRRAVVAFADSIEEDALRRDFTMNAIYATPSGMVMDPLGGLPDVERRVVRFIQDASKRIQEDYLRSLRFFRFHAFYGDADAGLDPEGLDAIARNLDGLDSLSKERIGAEMLKLLSAPDPVPSMAAMAQTGALARILPGAIVTALGPLVHLEANIRPNPIRRLAAIGGDDAAFLFRLSNQQAKELSQIRQAALEDFNIAELAYREGADIATNAVLVRAALLEQHAPVGFEKDVALGANAVFPVKAADVIDTFQGKGLGDRLRALETEWIRSGFQMTKSELLK